MLKFKLLALAAMTCVVGSANLKQVNVQKEELNAHIIVQVKGDATKMSEAQVLASQNRVLSEILTNITTSYKVEERYTSSLNGFVLNVNASHVDAIRRLNSVYDVNYNRQHAAMPLNNDELVHALEFAHSEASDNISSDTMYKPEESNEGEGVLIAIMDTGSMVNASINGTTGVTHDSFTALDPSVTVKETKESIQEKIAQNPGFHGKNDKTHSTYWNNKVPFYYDYGGTSHVSGTAGPEDFDVFDEGQPHGNHVASIAAGNDPLYKGIAPKAQIAVMNVFTAYEPTDADIMAGASASYGAYDSAMIKAFEDAEALGVDIVNLSLGSTLNDFDEDSILYNLVTRLQKGGMLINYAAGNDGKNQFASSMYEYWTTDMVETGILSGEANNPFVMDVAAAQANKEYFDTAFVVGDKTVAFKDQIEDYNTADGEVHYDVQRHLTDLLVDHPDGKFQFVKVGGWGEEDDYDGVDAEGKIVIVDRGETTFLEKINVAISHGAIAVGIINNDPTELDFNFRMDLSGNTPSVPVILILNKDKAVFDNATVTECQLLVETEANNPTAKTMASFSSDGPVHNLTLKPEISAPGQSILGAVYAQDSHGQYITNGYDYYDGTSMATPNMVGAAALILSEHLDNPSWRESINARIMSTADPMKDQFGTNFESVRRQGAGMVNIASAINTNAYLDGSTDASKLSNKAKIELQNNSDIKNGDLKLSFTIVNESSSAITYSASTLVYRPELVTMTNENFGEKFVGKTVQATYDHLIDTVSNTVSVGANETKVINLPTYTLSASEKQTINDNFPYGCYIEGYVILKADGQEDLSIPFLGFYGDASGAIPIEPFAFEKEAGRLYASDLLSGVASYFGGFTNADFSSDWVYGNFDSFEDVSMEGYLLSEKKLRDMVDTNAKSLTGVGFNPYTGEYDPQNIYVGNNGFANTMIITNYVMRSVATNTITLTNKASGKVVLVDHMYDSLFGATEDASGKEVAWPLFKSFAVADYWSSGICAHEAYTIIPLYENIEHVAKDGTVSYTKGELYPDGEYEMEFDYTLTDGSKYTKSYTIHIDSGAPTIKSVDEVENNGEKYIRVRYTEDYLSYVNVSGSAVLPEKDDKGYYVDIKFSDLTGKNCLFLKAFDMAGANSVAYTRVEDENHITVINKNMSASLEMTSTITDIDTFTKDVVLKFKKSGKTFEVKNDITINMKLFKNFADIKVLVYTGANSQEVEFKLEDGFITFNVTKDLHFRIVSGVDPTVDPEPIDDPDDDDDKKKGCGGSIIVSSSILAIVSALGLTLLLKRRKYSD